MGRQFVAYTALRVVVFAGCYGLLLVLGLRGPFAVLAALLLSSLVSLVLLRRQRDAVTASLAARSQDRAAEQARLRGLLDEDGPRGPDGRSEPAGPLEPDDHSEPGSRRDGDRHERS